MENIINTISYYRLSLIFIILLSTIFGLTALLKPKGVIEFSKFRKIVSIFDNGVRNYMTFSQIMFVFILTGINIKILLDLSDTGLSLLIDILFVVMSIIASVVTIKAIYFIFDSKEDIYYCYIYGLLKEKYDKECNVFRLIKSNSSQYGSIINKIYTVLNYGDYMSLIGDQLILLDEMYNTIPRNDKYNSKVAEYVRNLNDTLDDVIKIEEENKVKRKKEEEDYFNEYFDDKLSTIIKSNNDFRKAINTKRLS